MLQRGTGRRSFLRLRTSRSASRALVGVAAILASVQHLSAQALAVTSPNGGEAWENGSLQMIAWDNTGFSGNVDILLSSDGGTSYADLFSNIINTGSKPWVVNTGAPGAEFRIHVRAAVASHLPADESDGDFTITAAACTPQWLPREGVPGGMNASVFALEVYDGNLIAGGFFTTVGGVSANYIAHWNGTNWSPLSTGMNAGVRALTVYNGKLIACGAFSNAGGSSVSSVAQWDGLSWAPVGTGVVFNGPVTDLAVFNGKLIAGGIFTTVGGVGANRIAQWDGTSWAPMGSGMDGTVNCFTIYNSRLIAGGSFSTAGGVLASRIAQWNGTNWSALGAGLSNFVSALTVYDGGLIAGGAFFGGTLNYVARWNGTSWSSLGGGMNSGVSALTKYNGKLIAAGAFTVAGGTSASKIAQWDGAAWSPFGIGINGNVEALTVHDGNLIAGGHFTAAGGNPSAYLARWGCLHAATVTSQPEDVIACRNGAAMFSITVSGTLPLSYQWRKGNSFLVDGLGTDGTTVSGALTDTLTLTNVRASDEAADYNCIVTNSAGSTTSGNAALIVQGSGDINEDDASDSSDIPGFVAVLLGEDTMPIHVIHADTNCDGLADGRDIQPFVMALVQ